MRGARTLGFVDSSFGNLFPITIHVKLENKILWIHLKTGTAKVKEEGDILRGHCLRWIRRDELRNRDVTK